MIYDRKFPIISISLAILFSSLINFTYGQEEVNETSFMNQSRTEKSKTSTVLESSSNGLQILSHNSFTDSAGYMHVVGEIKNNSTSIATFVKIIGTFYDVNNQVVATDFTYTNPENIGSRQKAPFDLTLTSASIPVSQIDHYNLQASSR